MSANCGVCPAIAPYEWRPTTYKGANGADIPSVYMAYAVNMAQLSLDGAYFSSNENGWIYYWLRMGKLRQPSSHTILFDSFDTDWRTQNVGSIWGTNNIYLVHANKANTLFADGHVASSTRSEMVNRYGLPVATAFVGKQ